jgi:hypothetical protein
LLKLDDFTESAVSLGAAVYASAGEDHYEHFKATPIAAAYMCRSAMNTSNMAKFDCFTKGDVEGLEKLNAEDSPVPSVITEEPEIKWSNKWGGGIPLDENPYKWKATVHKDDTWKS